MNEAASTAGALEQRIRAEIRRHGPIPLRRFLELALYDPEQGYYRGGRDPFGWQGDFFTNSQLQPVFGRLLAQQFAAWRQSMGGRGKFQVVDWGCGRGETIEVIRRSLAGAECIGVELDAGQRPHGIRGVVYANELFDALPAHLVERRGNELVEHYVHLRGNRLQWIAGEPSSPELEEYVTRYAPGLAGGQQIEVSLDALAVLEDLAARLKCGYLLIVDYGYTSGEIAGGRRFPCGSLMSYRQHHAYEDVLAEPGRRDITHHVNFTAIEARASELGMQSLGLRSQAKFLLEAGAPDQFASALAARGEAEAQRLHLQLKTLLAGLGEVFRVLVLRK